MIVKNEEKILDRCLDSLQGIYDELLEFFTCILENRMPQTGSLEFALELTKVYEALMESRGNRIDL